MDLIDRLKAIAERIAKAKDQVTTEEATKNAFVMPFISALGYDVFNPLEVVPEFTADVGLKKGEKVDYCILRDGKPILIIECKHWKEALDNHDSQLVRYFHNTETRFALLTNGITYRFFTDLAEANKMDSKPFFEFSLENITEVVLSELKKFQKDNFDEEAIMGTASDLKYSKQIRELLAQELKDPSEDFVKYFASRIYSGPVTAKVREQFKRLVQKSAKQYFNETINERLKTALATNEEATPSVPEEQEEVTAEDDGIVTTEEERAGFRIVQAILSQTVSPARVHMRDTKSYCSVLFDDNNRKPICRMYFNSRNKYLGIVDERREIQKFPIEKVEDIYNFSEAITARAKIYNEEEAAV